LLLQYGYGRLTRCGRQGLLRTVLLYICSSRFLSAKLCFPVHALASGGLVDHPALEKGHLSRRRWVLLPHELLELLGMLHMLWAPASLLQRAELLCSAPKLMRQRIACSGILRQLLLRGSGLLCLCSCCGLQPPPSAGCLCNWWGLN
jgi:hypothetical protein